MTATTQAINFATMIAKALRASIKPVPCNDLFLTSTNVEREETARLYEAAVARMTSTGEWHLPTDADLDDAKARAWAWAA